MSIFLLRALKYDLQSIQDVQLIYRVAKVCVCRLSSLELLQQSRFFLLVSTLSQKKIKIVFVLKLVTFYLLTVKTVGW